MPSVWKYNDLASANIGLGQGGFHVFDDSVEHVSRESAQKMPKETSFELVTTFAGGIVVNSNIDYVALGYVAGDSVTISDVDPLLGHAYAGNWTTGAVTPTAMVVLGPTFTISAAGAIKYDNVNVPSGHRMYHEDLNRWNKIQLLKDNPSHVAGTDIETETLFGTNLSLSNLGVSTTWITDLLGQIITGPFDKINANGNTIIAYKG